MDDFMGPPPGMGYDGMRGYGDKDRGFLDKLFGRGRQRNDWIGGTPMDVDLNYDDRFPMPRDYGLRDYPPRGYGYDLRTRDFSPGRAWMASRAREPEFDLDFYDAEDLLPPMRRDPVDDLDLMISRRRDPLRDIPRRDPIDMMLERNDGPRLPLRSEPDFVRGRREYRGDMRPMSEGRVKDRNANLGWSQNKATRGPFEIPKKKADVVEQPKYKFNSPEHQWHVKDKFDGYEMEKNKNRQKHIRERLDEFEDDRRRDRYDDRYDDRRGGGGRGRRGRRRDDEYSEEDYDDDDNPYHHLPAHHIPKDDYDNAVRRNLHAWSQWRTDMNERGGRDHRVSNRL